MTKCVHVYVCVEVRGEPWVSFLGAAYLSFADCLSLGPVSHYYG